MEQSISTKIKTKILHIKSVVELQEAKGEENSQLMPLPTHFDKASNLSAELDELYELGCQAADFIEAVQRAGLLIQD